MPSRRYAIIEAPSNLGLRSTGVERLGDRLIADGLAERLGARRACGSSRSPIGTGAIPRR
jgi:arginase